MQCGAVIDKGYDGAQFQLSTLLCEPVKRVPRYKMVLEQVRKNTPPEMQRDLGILDAVIGKLHDVALYIDEAARRWKLVRVGAPCNYLSALSTRCVVMIYLCVALMAGGGQELTRRHLAIVHGKLTVEVAECRDLKKKDWFSENDDFVVLTLHDGPRTTERQTTILQNAGSNPLWKDEVHPFPVASSAQHSVAVDDATGQVPMGAAGTLGVVAFDADSADGVQRKRIGGASVPLAQLTAVPEQPIEREPPVFPFSDDTHPTRCYKIML